jgi:hypothetical protein
MLTALMGAAHQLADPLEVAAMNFHVIEKALGLLVTPLIELHPLPPNSPA